MQPPYRVHLYPAPDISAPTQAHSHWPRAPYCPELASAPRPGSFGDLPSGWGLGGLAMGWPRLRPYDGRTMADLTDRYGFESPTACVDVRVKAASNVFAPRDPAPLVERDRDSEITEYIVASAEELPVKIPVTLVFWLAEPSSVDPRDLAAGITRHFTFDRLRASRAVRVSRRQARWMLVLGSLTLLFFLALGELTLSREDHPFGKVVNTGFTILGWVAMWRPLEALLYDWWRLLQRRRLSERLARAPVEVR